MNNLIIKIFGVFNNCSETNIPLENLIHLDSTIFEKHILSFYQNQNALEVSIKNAYPGKKAILHGLSIKHFLSRHLFTLARLIISEKPDIIHVHHGFSGLVACILGRIFSKAKIVVTVHSIFSHYTRFNKLFFLLTYKCSDLIVCNSHTTQRSLDKVKKRIFPHTPTVVIYNGIDVYNIQCKSGHCDEFNPLIIGSIGRIVPAKDYPTLLAAFAALNKIIINSKLIIIGDGPLRKQLEETADVLKIRHKVEFCGSLPRLRVYEKLTLFHLFVVSSKWEGFCNAMVEAMAANIPIVASRIDTLIEVLGADNGTFFTPGDAVDLCQKMVDCHNAYTRIKINSDRACCLARERYALDVSSEHYRQAYESLLGK